MSKITKANLSQCTNDYDIKRDIEEGKQAIQVVVEELTDCMQMRVRTKSDPKWTDFVCGIDTYELQDGRLIITSNIGVFGYDFREFVANFMSLYGLYYKNLSDVIEFIFCDDPIHDTPNKVIVNERTMEDIDKPLIVKYSKVIYE